MIKKRHFTLIELMAAMGVFSIIMVIMLSFLSSTQKAWSETSSTAEVYENARIALDLLTRDIQSSLYNNDDSSKGIYPFWHESDSRINFISATNVGGTAISNIREVKYTRSNGTITPDDLGNGTPLKPGWLVRSVTGDSMVDATDSNDRTKIDNKYNFLLFPRSCPEDPSSYPNPWKSERLYRVFKEITGGTNTANKSSDDFNYVIPNVVSLKFTCYGYIFDGTQRIVVDMRDVNGDGVSGAFPTDVLYNFDSTVNASPTRFPCAIKIDLVLLDKTSWEKWKAMCGAASWDAVVAAPDTELAGNSKTFRENKQRTFTTTIYLGERESN